MRFCGRPDFGGFSDVRIPRAVGSVLWVCRSDGGSASDSPSGAFSVSDFDWSALIPMEDILGQGVNGLGWTRLAD